MYLRKSVADKILLKMKLHTYIILIGTECILIRGDTDVKSFEYHWIIYSYVQFKN